MARLHVWIKGTVQGVMFRDATRRLAEDLGLTGWVKNLPEGSVEAVFEGDRGDCERALEFARSGPESAQVEAVEERWDEAEESFEAFSVEY